MPSGPAARPPQAPRAPSTGTSRARRGHLAPAGGAADAAPVNDWLAERADPQPGQTVLEIAAGTGDLGLRLAERVGATGRVISTDFAPQMVDVARRNGSARGLGNVEYRVLDAERMD